MNRSNEEFYECPICGQKPVIRCTYNTATGEKVLMAFCPCHRICSTRGAERLKHLWNDIYCADDIWIAFDEGDD